MKKTVILWGLVALFAATAGAAPYINRNGIVSAASFAPALSVDGSIAQGSIFAIFGTGLGPAATTTATAYPLQNTLAGVSVQVIAGTTTLNAIPIAVSAAQVSAIMPSGTPVGTVSVQLTFNGAASNMAPVNVVVNSPGLFSANASGAGPGILQNYLPSGAVPTNSTQNTVAPGQIGVLWLTGLGPTTAPDNQAPPVATLSFPVEIWVGGVQVPSANILYSGRTPCCAGEDEIVFTIPTTVPTGCYVPVTTRVAGQAVSNTVTVAIGGSLGNSGTACSDPISGAYTQGGNFGTIALIRRMVRVPSLAPPNSLEDGATAGFVQEPGGPFAFSSLASMPPAGSCTVYQGLGNFTGAAAPFSTPGTPLMAGTLTVGGPAGPVTLLSLGGGYLADLGSTNVVPASENAPGPFLSAGSYTVAGTAGTNVGAFSVPVTVPGSNITWTNESQITTVDRTQPLTFTWSGTSYLVSLEGVNYDVPTNSSTAFRCIAPSGATSFTVPPWILANFSPTRANPYSSRSFVDITSATSPVAFQATGLNNAAAYYVLLQALNVTYK